MPFRVSYTGMRLTVYGNTVLVSYCIVLYTHFDTKRFTFMFMFMTNGPSVGDVRSFCTLGRVVTRPVMICVTHTFRGEHFGLNGVRNGKPG